MNYYEVLRLTRTATQMDIDRAYARLVKEASFNDKLNRKEIEVAYRALRDPTQRSLYDYSLDEDRKRVETTQRHKLKAQKRQSILQNSRYVVAVLLLIALVYVSLRFGYRLKNYSEGETLYLKSTNALVGKVIRKEDDHSFGSVRADAYLIEKSNGQQVWLPESDLQISCYSQ